MSVGVMGTVLGLPGMYPAAPIVPTFQQLSAMNPQQWRMFQFGPYLFPVTFQERSRDSKLSLIKKKMPFTPGDYNPGNTSLAGRTTELFGSIAPGMQGFSGNLLRTQDDVENERGYLAGLQALGQQSLYCRADRFMWAYLEDFSISQTDATGFRMFDWVAKFYAQDPRYYGASSYAQNNYSGNQTSGGLPNMNSVTYPDGEGSNALYRPFVHAGNTAAFPIIVFTALNGSGNIVPAPHFGFHAGPPNNPGAIGLGIHFSQLNLYSGNHPINASTGSADQLVVLCDPRPEYAFICATYYPGYGFNPVQSGAPNQWPQPNTAATNAMAYVQPSDFTNNVNYQFFLPFISSTSVSDGIGLNTIGYGQTPPSGSGGQYSVQVLYWDTYI